MDNFTVGDWWVRERVTNGVNGYEICWSKDAECVTDHVYEIADAHLMAASKELYSALDAIYGEAAFDGLPEIKQEAVITALKNARGE